MAGIFENQESNKLHHHIVITLWRLGEKEEGGQSIILLATNHQPVSVYTIGFGHINVKGNALKI